MKQRAKFDADAFIERYAKGLGVEYTKPSTVTPDTPKFFYVTHNFNPLPTLENKPCSDVVTPITSVTRKNYNNIINKNKTYEYNNIIDTNNSLYTEIFEERAAIVEYDFDIPRIWAEAIAKMYIRTKPKSINQKKWNVIIKCLDMLCDNSNLYIKSIIDFDWRISDIFGCHKAAPEVRHDFMGLLILLNEGDKIIQINRNTIKIQTTRGTIQSYYRPCYNYLIDQSYLFEI